MHGYNCSQKDDECKQNAHGYLTSCLNDSEWQPVKRILSIDSKTKLLAVKGQDQLGLLTKSRLKPLYEEETESTQMLQELQEEKGYTVPFLKSQWEEQKWLQLSVKACTSFHCSNVKGPF